MDLDDQARASGVATRGAPPLFAAILFARPRLLLRALALMILLCTLAMVFIVLDIPLASVGVTAGRGDNVELSDGIRTVSVAGDSPVLVRNPHGQVAIRARLLLDTAEPAGTADEAASFWRDRDRLADMVAAGSAELIAGEARFTFTHRERSLASLPAGFWMSLIAGALSALAGVWIWILRPLNWGPAMFALSGIGLFGGCATIAIAVVGGLAMSGTLYHALLIINGISGLTCAGALMALFARFPKPLATPGLLWGLGAAHILGALVYAFELTSYAADMVLIIVMADSIAIVLLACRQAWLAGRARRAAFLPIAIGTVISVTLFLILSVDWQFSGALPLVGPELTAPLFLLIYLGLGISVARLRLFALGSWALSLLASACAILLFLLLDPIILATVTQKQDEALLVSAFLAVAVYLPAREWLLRRAERLRDGQARAMLRHAVDIAMAATPDMAMAAWRGAVATMFDPLETETISRIGDDPDLEEAGSALYLPAPMPGEALRLRFPQGGTRTFSPDDLEAARQFGELVAWLADARDAYVRGVAEERSRIARDLHDDVSARLLTSLHRRDAAMMQEDVRDAMADIRTIVAGLKGAPRILEDAIADLRHESLNRLEAAGLGIDWPLFESDAQCLMLDHGQHRAIVSIVRECMTNVMRHAQASQVRVAVTSDGERLHIVIADNGAGLASRWVEGNGIANARRRASELGGRFDIVPTDGWTVASLDLPLRRPGHDGMREAALEKET